MARIYFDGTSPAIEGNLEPGHTGGGGQPPMDERISRIETRLDSLEKNVATVQTDLSAIKTQMTALEKNVATLASEASSVRWWILGTCITIILSVGMIVIAFGQYQSSWFQLALNHNWEIAQKSLDKIEDAQLRLERLDAQREAQQTEKK